MFAWFSHSLSSTVCGVCQVFFFFSTPGIYSWGVMMKPCGPNNQQAEVKRGQRHNNTSTALWLHHSLDYTGGCSCHLRARFCVKTDWWQGNTRRLGHTRRSTRADKAVCGGWGVWIGCKKLQFHWVKQRNEQQQTATFTGNWHFLSSLIGKKQTDSSTCGIHQ